MQQFTVQVNGAPHRIDDERTLRAWLAVWRLDTVQPFVVAVNDEHVSHSLLTSRRPAPGDRIEVLTVHQGG